MSLLSLVLVLILIGLGLYLVNNYVPMDAKLKSILNVVVVVVVVIWILQSMFGPIGDIRIGR
jgi:hypothetical protein